MFIIFTYLLGFSSCYLFFLALLFFFNCSYLISSLHVIHLFLLSYLLSIYYVTVYLLVFYLSLSLFTFQFLLSPFLYSALLHPFNHFIFCSHTFFYLLITYPHPLPLCYQVQSRLAIRPMVRCVKMSSFGKTTKSTTPSLVSW